MQTPDPNAIDSPTKVAEFVAACEIENITAEAGRVILHLKIDYRDRYTLDFATKRVSRAGDQIHLRDEDTGETLYRK